jgi:ribosomal protein S27E
MTGNINFMFDGTVPENVKCPSCLETSPATEWEDTDIYCEDCGDHAAVRCPKCEEVFDTISTTSWDEAE